MSQELMIHLGSLNPLEQFLCLTLSGDLESLMHQLVASLDELDEEQLWCFTEEEGVSSIVASAIQGHLKSHRWNEAAQSMGSRISLYVEQLDRVADSLAMAGIPLVALKNSGIARGIYRKPAACPMGDIDVLVRPDDFIRAHAVMLKLGFKLDDRSPFKVEDIGAAERHGGAEYTYQLADGSTLWFELQWRPVAGRWIQPDQEPPADELMERSVPIEGTTARLLSPEDNLLQVCLHTAKHSYVRAPGFRLHTDVDRIVRACEIDWDLFCKRVENIRVRTAVYLSLLIPKALLNTPVPIDVLTRLDHAPLKHRLLQRWLLKVGLFGPHEKKWGKLGYIVFNLMLYDTIGGVLRGIFPDGDWMRKHYGVKRRWTLPFWYAVRAFELIFKRART